MTQKVNETIGKDIKAKASAVALSKINTSTRLQNPLKAIALEAPVQTFIK
jgi:hypothetical protein